uniref:Transcription elongation factor SII n=1 Tax=Trepomonas sp. PC1 TaxID=1076344 RepID=A0A146KC98_9EUKA|eukprot:JAP94440.1 Transcription elongation factor SII [Trepomonas sp. PC1]
MDYITEVDSIPQNAKFQAYDINSITEYPKSAVKKVETDKFQNRIRSKAREILLAAFNKLDFDIFIADAKISAEQFDQLLQQYKVADSEFCNVIFQDAYVYFQPIHLQDYIEQLECYIYKEIYVNEIIADSATPSYLNKILLFKTAFEQHQSTLMSKIFFGQIPPSVLVTFQAADLEGPQLQQKRKIAQEQINASKDLERFIVVTDTECKKCHRKTVVAQEKQSRSADEAMTVTYTCTACGFKWARN